MTERQNVLQRAFSVLRARRDLSERRIAPQPAHIRSGLEKPFTRALGVGDGLLRGERLAGNNEQSRGRVALEQNLGEVGAVHIAAEVALQVSLRVLFQGLGDHDGAEVGAADANVDD